MRLDDGPRSIVRFDIGFVHELSEGKPRFFAMVTEVEGAVISEAAEDSEGHRSKPPEAPTGVAPEGPATQVRCAGPGCDITFMMT